MRDPVTLLNFSFVLAAASACPKAWSAWKRFSARGPSPKTGTALTGCAALHKNPNECSKFVSYAEGGYRSAASECPLWVRIWRDLRLAKALRSG